MVKRLLFFTFALLFIQISEVFSQINIATVDAGPYTPGSSIAATFTIGSTCIRPGNRFDLFLVRPDGTEIAPAIGSYNGFYSTFVNGVIPAGTLPGAGYKLRIKSTTPVLTSDDSPPFDIQAGTPVLASVSSFPELAFDASGKAEVFGYCPGRDNAEFIFSNTSMASSVVTGVIKNEITGLNEPPLSFNSSPPDPSFMARLGHYTVFITSKLNGTVGTRAYLIVNNNINNSFGTTGSNIVCLPGGFLQYSVDLSTTGIKNNFPGTTYEIKWGDANEDTEVFTICDLAAGYVRHEYTESSCGQPVYNTGNGNQYNVFGINISAVSPFCPGSGAGLSTFVRVVTKPDNSFTAPVAACTGSTVNFTNTSVAGQTEANTPECTDNNIRYNWFVDNVRVATNEPKSYVLSHLFADPGVHTIRLESLINGLCNGVPVTHEICIQDPPQPAFDFNNQPQTGCAPFSIQAFDRSVIDTRCNADNIYNWIVNGPAGVQFNPTDKNPTFTFTTPGTYEIILEIQTASCGAVRTQIPQQIILADGAPIATLSPDATLCALNTFNFDDVTTGPTRTILTGTQQDVPNTTYTWYVTESDGSALAAGDFSFEGGTDLHTKYPIIKFNQFKAYKIRVVHVNSCGQNEDSQLITFSPSPVPEIIANPNPICYDADVNLEGSITAGSYSSFTWLGNGGSFSDPSSLTPIYTPSPTERNAGTTTIRLRVNTGLQGACANVEDSLVVNILPNNTGTNITQQICSGTSAAHTAASTVAGSTFSWTVTNPDGNASGYLAGSGTAITDLITNNSPTANAVVIYTITPVSNGCTGVPYTFTVTVTPAPVITATAANPTICSDNATAITLTSNLPNTRYTWTTAVTGSITGNADVTTPTTAATIDDMLINSGTTSGTVTYTITPYSDTDCPGTPITVAINVDPALTVANAGADKSTCASSNYTLEGNPAVVGTGTWTNTSTTNTTVVTFADPNDPATIVSGLNPGETYQFTWTISAPGACAPTADEVEIVVNEPTVPGTTSGAATVCANSNTGTITLSGNVGSVIEWQSSPDGITWTPVPGNNTATTYTSNNLTVNTHFRAAVQNGACTIDYSTPTLITVVPGTTVPNAGPDQTICAQTSVLLDADATLKPGEIGRWTVSSATPNAFVTDPTNPKSTVTGLTAGLTYLFTWTISGNSPCDPLTDEISIINNLPINQSISSTSAVVCNGQQVTIDGSIPTGGDGTNYTYTWEIKIDGGAWEVIADATDEDLTLPLTTTGTVSFRRNVTSGGCPSTSNELIITVQPPIDNNTIAADQTICSGTTPEILTGSTPTGGDGQFLYQWQSSIDGTTWADITGALTQNYQPPILTQTTFYRRTVGTLACSGSLQNASLAIKITVNPNAEAEYTFIADSGCAPFPLQITAVDYPDRNTTYTWFANGTQIGTGLMFPGYTIANSNERVTIRLAVTSSLGCTDDEFLHDFTTNQAVPASFTQNTTEGCGPLTVNFVNTSLQTAGAMFKWKVGNTEISSSANPPPYTFQPDPTGKDTTYTVTLYSITICGTDSAKGTVLVKSPPRPIFSPDRTDGCSALTVNFSNNSPLQTDITYTFNFGDGSPPVQTTDRSTVPHTYLTTTNVQTFRATMTARNLCGTVTTLPYEIVVRPNTVNAELVVNGPELVGCAPHTVTFDNNSTGANSFTVDFNDGTQPRGSIISPEKFQYTFTNPGTYKVFLTATNGCSTDTTSETITVRPQPLTDFEADQTLGCTGLAVKFINKTQNGVSYIWDFGDGSPTSFDFEPTHTYTGDQEYYTVTLTATNALGCPTTVSKTNFIHIVQPPAAAFTVNPSTIINIPDYTFYFQDESTNTPTIWEWDFGDGTSSALKNPNHTYPDTGTYKVTLKVSNQQRCFTTTFKKVTIKGVPGYLFLPNSFIPGDTRPELRDFRAKGSGIATWRFSIFNKWGQLLWETTKLEEGRPVEGWDGTFKGQPMPQGVYFWKIDVQMVNGSEWKGMTYDKSAPKRTGPIHLIR